MREGENSHWNYSELRYPSWLFVSERLVESLRLPQVPTLHSQVFLFFRVLLLRMSPQHLTSLWPTMITELVSCRCLSLFRRLVHIWDTTSFLLKIFKKITSRDCAYKCAMDTNWKLTYFHSPDVWFLWWNWVSVGLHCFSCSAVSWIKFAFALIVPCWILLQFLLMYVYPLHHSHSCSSFSVFPVSTFLLILLPAMGMRTHVKESESMVFWQLVVVRVTLWLNFVTRFIQGLAQISSFSFYSS